MDRCVHECDKDRVGYRSEIALADRNPDFKSARRLNVCYVPYGTSGANSEFHKIHHICSYFARELNSIALSKSTINIPHDTPVLVLYISNIRIHIQRICDYTVCYNIQYIPAYNHIQYISTCEVYVYVH